MRERHRPRAQKIVQPKVADRLNHSGQDKPEGKDQGDAVMRPAETDECVRGIAEAEKRTAHFQIQIIGWRSKEVCLPGRINHEEVEGPEYTIDDGRKISAIFAEEPFDLPPIAQNNPQLPEKPGQGRK